MIRVKIDKNRRNEPIFKMNFKDLTEKEQKILKRVFMESKEITGNFKYETPLKYFCFITNIIEKERLIIDKHSKLTYYEFSDRYDEKYYYSFDINPKYMKKWREEECPQIFKVEVNRETLDVTKEIIFKKIEPRNLLTIKE